MGSIGRRVCNCRKATKWRPERETWEELGLRSHLNGIRPHFSVNFADGFDDYYCFINVDVDIESLNLQEEEVQKMRYG